MIAITKLGFYTQAFVFNVFFELQDILFTFKLLKYPTKGFSILHYISFTRSSSDTQSSSSHKLKHLSHANNSTRHLFFHQLP